MSSLQQTAPRRQAPISRNPFKTPKRPAKPPVFNRHVRRQQVTQEGQVISVTKSFSNETKIYHPVVNIETGYIFCNCDGFHFHYSKFEPTIWDPSLQCRHLKRAIANCRRRGELPLLQASCGHGPLEEHECASMQSCALCGQPEAQYEMCDNQGEVIPGKRICETCAHDQGDDLADAAPEAPAAPPSTPAPRPAFNLNAPRSVAMPDVKFFDCSDDADLPQC